VIRTNLSTRPFYNARAVNVLLALFALIVFAATAYNVIEIVRLSSSQRTLGAKASTSEREATRLRAEAAQAIARVDQKELAAVAKAASEANSIIDQRTFSWTDVFAHFEKTLPPDVRVTSVQQQAGRGLVLIEAESRNIDDIDQFIEALEKTGAFRDVIARNEVLMENDNYNATLEATYVPLSRTAKAQP
jgi:Tfp pilus assembly protein PilN